MILRVFLQFFFVINALETDTLSKHGIPIPSSKQRKKQSSNETEENDVSIDDLYLIAQEIIKIETPLKPKYFSMNSKIYNAYLTKKSEDEPDVLAWGSIKQQKSSKNKKKRNKEGIFTFIYSKYPR